MNDNHRHADFENLEPPLQAAVKAALAEPIPEDAIERVKSRAKQLGDCPNFRPSENGTVPFAASVERSPRATLVGDVRRATSTCRSSW